MAKVELKKKWWLASRPKEIKGVELEKALALIESAGDDKRAAALNALAPAIAKTLKELDKNKHKDLFKELAALDALADNESKKILALTKAKIAAKIETEVVDAADDGETPEDKLFDPELHRNTIKRALRQPLVFAFAIGNKPELCALALSPRGNPAAFARLARKQSGAAKVCYGQAQAADGDAKKLVLTLEGPPVSGIVKSLRLYLQKHKITLFRKLSVLVDGREAEAESLEEESPVAAPAPVATPGAGPTPPPAEAPEPPPTPQQLEALEDRRRDFKKARAAWVAVKLRAEEDLEKVKDGAHTAYVADREQFPKVVAGCKEIDAILDHLDDELRDTLDQYASTPLRNQRRLQALAATANEVLDRYLKFVAANPVMKAIDLKEFAEVTVHAPVLKALTALRKALS